MQFIQKTITSLRQTRHRIGQSGLYTSIQKDRQPHHMAKDGFSPTGLPASKCPVKKNYQTLDTATLPEEYTKCNYTITFHQLRC